MILRRVIHHVRNQEWTAIWIDLVIVVVGVFIGIQVSNWNEASADRAAYEAAKARRLMGRLLVMRDPIALDAVVRADLLSQINELRSLTEFEALNALQRMRVIVDLGSAPKAGMVDAFLNGAATNATAADSSRTVQLCKAKGLPLADWHDLEKASSSSALFPGAGLAK